MVTELGQYWHEQRYEEAVTQVCRVLHIAEEAHVTDSQLLVAAESTEFAAWLMDPLDLLDPLDASFANLALFGCSCCNRLAESHLRAGDWRVAAHWCALGRQLELDSPDAEWVAVRFKRLFHAAEAMRLAGKSEKKATGKVSRSLLLSSRSCLEACESLWARQDPEEILQWAPRRHAGS